MPQILLLYYLQIQTALFLQDLCIVYRTATTLNYAARPQGKQFELYCVQLQFTAAANTAVILQQKQIVNQITLNNKTLFN